MSKYEYIKQSISNLSPHLFSPQTKISLIQFHNQARLADCKDIEQGALTRLSTELEISFSDVGTNFEAPLKLTQRLLLQDRSDPTWPSFHEPDRSLVVFLTDGRHRADEEIHQLEQLVELYPQLDALLAPAISSLRQKNPALQLGQTFKNLVSQVGKLFINSSPPRPQQSDPNRRGHEPLYNPSPVTIVKGMGRPNTAVNDYAEPRQRLASSLSMPDYFHVLVGESKQKAQVIPLSMLQEGGSLVIGRAPLMPSGQSDCTLVQIAHDKVASPFKNRFLSLRLNHLSRTHFSITRQQNTYFIIDLGSTNGTQLNGQKLHAKMTYPLNDGDTICVGDLEFVLSAPKGA